MDDLVSKNRLIIAFILGVLGIFIGVLVGNYFVKGDSSRQNGGQSLATEEGVSLSLSPDGVEADVGDSFPVDIKLKAENMVLSGVALRLVYEYEGDLPLEPQDTKLTVNPDMVGQDWAFPVNSLEVDKEGKMVVAELAAVNLNPSGYPADGELTLATLDFVATSASSTDLVFKFDQEQTKVLTKDGREVEVFLKDASYSVD